MWQVLCVHYYRSHWVRPFLSQAVNQKERKEFGCGLISPVASWQSGDCFCFGLVCLFVFPLILAFQSQLSSSFSGNRPIPSEGSGEHLKGLYFVFLFFPLLIQVGEEPGRWETAVLERGHLEADNRGKTKAWKPNCLEQWFSTTSPRTGSRTSSWKPLFYGFYFCLSNPKNNFFLFLSSSKCKNIENHCLSGLPTY